MTATTSGRSAFTCSTIRRTWRSPMVGPDVQVADLRDGEAGERGRQPLEPDRDLAHLRRARGAPERERGGARGRRDRGTRERARDEEAAGRVLRRIRARPQQVGEEHAALDREPREVEREHRDEQEEREAEPGERGDRDEPVERARREPQREHPDRDARR